MATSNSVDSLSHEEITENYHFGFSTLCSDMDELDENTEEEKNDLLTVFVMVFECVGMMKTKWIFRILIRKNDYKPYELNEIIKKYLNNDFLKIKYYNYNDDPEEWKTIIEKYDEGLHAYEYFGSIKKTDEKFLCFEQIN